jgi:TPR repeat protein
LNTELDGKIVAYLTEAEEQGFTQAYYNLGMVYSKGIAGQKNSDLALQMFYEGSLKGDYKCKIKFAYELMNQTSILKEEYEEHYHLAIHWLESVVRRLSINHATVSQPP